MSYNNEKLKFKGAFAVTKSDATVLSNVKGLYIGSNALDVTVDLASGETDVVFKLVPVGTILPIEAVKVKAATTATDIVALT